MKGKATIKRTAGKTWVGLKNQDFLTPEFMNKLGRFLVSAIVMEAKKDLARQGNKPTPPGEKEGVPNSERFFESFSYNITQDNKIEVTSSWPWISQIVEGRQSFSMDWLTKSDGVTNVPMRSGNQRTTVIVGTPTGDKVWVHPGFRKHTFIRRGYENALRKFRKELKDQVLKTLRKTRPL